MSFAIRFGDDSDDEMVFDEDEDEDMFDEEEPASPNGSSVAGGLSGELAALVPCPRGFSAVISNLLRASPAAQTEFSFGGRAPMPSAPGLQVEGLGTVPLPLRSPFAEQLVAACERAPYGKDFDTLLDDSVRKSWQLSPDKVALVNPDWDLQMKTLVDEIAQRLGYQGIPLSCPLYKLLVYGPGGHFVRHKDTEKADGMFATLVVQLPSLHEGGDLVVYSNKKVKGSGSEQQNKESSKCETEQRHDFGKSTGTAPFAVHYAVHYADAEHALEVVTSGYRLVLVYSLCLPANMRDLDLTMITGGGDAEVDKQKATMALAIKGLVTDEQLSEEQEEELTKRSSAYDKANPLPSSFTLMLTHEYTESSICRMGCGALKGDDRERFMKLQTANESLPREHRLQFYVVKLSYDIEYYDTSGGFGGQFDWEESKRGESVMAWHGSGGNKLPFKRSGSESGYNEPSQKFPIQFLNPDNWTLEDFWGENGTNKYEGYMGNEGATKSTKYCQYGLVAWPLALDAAHSFTYISDTHAANVLREQRPLSANAVDVFLHAVEEVTTHSTNSYPRSYTKLPLSAEFSRSLLELLDDAQDARLVRFFFDNAFQRVDRKQDVTAPLASLITKFDWKEIGPSIIGCLAKFKAWGESSRYFDENKSMKCVDAIQLAVRFANGVLESSTPSQDAVRALARVAVDRIKTIVWADLPSTKFVTLWKVLAGLEDKSLESELISHFQGIDAVYTKTLVDSMSAVKNPSAEFQAACQAMAERRLAWLNDKINAAANAPAFSWEIPNAEFRGSQQVQAFLRGPEQTMTVRNMSGIQEARRYVQQFEIPRNTAFTMQPAGRGRDAHVVIAKTRQSQDANKVETVAMHQEAQRLAERFGGEAAALPSRFAQPSNPAAVSSPNATPWSAATNSRKRRQRQ
jgi:hypothetical protein